MAVRGSAAPRELRELWGPRELPALPGPRELPGPLVPRSVPVAVAVVALERRSVLAVVSVPASEPRVPGQRLAVVAEPQVPGQVSEPQVSEPQASEPQVPGPGQRLAPVAAQPEQEPRARPVAWLVPVSALQPEVKV
ncbi:MAG: hypothetical protein ACYTF5_11220, partial [Planctomycetota bacterium]